MQGESEEDMYTVKVMNAKENQNGLAKGTWTIHEFSKKEDAEEWKDDMKRLHPEIKCEVVKVEG